MGKNPPLGPYLCLFGQRKQNFEVKNLSFKINLIILREEVKEHKAHEKLGYPTTSPLVASEPIIDSHETRHPRETKEVVFQGTYFMVIEKSTEIEEETKKNRGTLEEEHLSDEKEEILEAICGINDPQGHPNLSNTE